MSILKHIWNNWYLILSCLVLANAFALAFIGAELLSVFTNVYIALLNLGLWLYDRGFIKPTSIRNANKSHV